jgi:uncharacterized protein YraI
MTLGISCNISRAKHWSQLARLALILIFATMPLVECYSAYAASPSFDCSKASQPDEKTICGSAELSALELKASQDFASVRDNIDSDRARQAARAALAERHSCGANVICIKGVLLRAIQSYETLGPRARSPVATQAQVLPGSYSIAPGVSEGILNMRSGPGQGHSVVVAIPAGSGGVTIGPCQAPDDGRSRNSWCWAQWKSHSGWVSSSGILAAPNEVHIASSQQSSNPVAHSQTIEEACAKKWEEDPNFNHVKYSQCIVDMTNARFNQMDASLCDSTACFYRLKPVQVNGLTDDDTVYQGAGYFTRYKPAEHGRDIIILDPQGGMSTFAQCGTCSGFDYQDGPLKDAILRSTGRDMILEVPQAQTAPSKGSPK